MDIYVPGGRKYLAVGEVLQWFAVGAMAGGATNPEAVDLRVMGLVGAEAERLKAAGNEKLKDGSWLGGSGCSAKAGSAKEALALYEQAMAKLPAKACQRPVRSQDCIGLSCSSAAAADTKHGRVETLN